MHYALRRRRIPARDRTTMMDAITRLRTGPVSTIFERTIM